MCKILFIAPYLNTFIKTDLNLLQKHHQVKELIFPRAYQRNLVYTLYTFFKIFSEMKKTDIAYVWFADLRAYLAVICAGMLKKKVVVVIGGYESASLPEIRYGGLIKKGQARRFRIILRKADHIITPSQFSLQEVQQVHSAARSSVISLGLPVNAAVKQFPAKEKLIVTVGNAVRTTSTIKGLLCFAETSISFPEYKFMIIGNYSEVEKVEIHKINKNIEFTGQISSKELFGILERTRIYCQLSLRESFGLAVLEAMQLGCIPVVTKVGALPEVVGETGFFTNYGDVDKTVSAINTALKSGDTALMQQRAAEKFDLKFREEKILNLLGNLYEN